ncbi:hypothetical protein D4758_06610 [Enterocloster citroniae]|nr:hypothetical protein [Enterocloster citroniae]
MTCSRHMDGNKKQKIALGFHACVDYELEWNLSSMEHLMEECEIHAGELDSVGLNGVGQAGDTERIESMKGLMIEILSCMRQGTGCEIIPEDCGLCREFAKNFSYKITIGGTAAKAAIAIGKIGYESTLGMCCFNQYMEDLLPAGITCYSGTGPDHDEVYPHIILQYPSGVHIQVNDIDFTTSCHNRILISRDPDSMNMVIAEDFGNQAGDADVFLLSCFSEVLDASILTKRLDTVFNLLAGIRDRTFVILEDGCYVNGEFRRMVHRKLAPVLDVISMNEDELQDFVGKRIQILDPDQVLDGVSCVYRSLKVPLLIIHTHAWALAYGTGSHDLKEALEGGIMLASARYVYGDEFGIDEYRNIRTWNVNERGREFSKQVMEEDPMVCCIPCRDLEFAKRPTTVGLGDFFAGGLLPALANRK